MITDVILRSENPETFNQYSSLEKRLIDVKVPDETNTYKPISYGKLIDKTLELCDIHGLQVESRRYVCNEKMTEVIAHYSFSGDHPNFGTQLAWRNSYNKSMSAVFTTGGHVFICGNGCVFGDDIFRKKHVGLIVTELDDAIKAQFDKIGETYDRMMKDFEYMQHRLLTPREMAELAGRLFIETELLTANELSALKRELMNPSFDYSYDGYNFQNNDLFSLYQHCTYVLKDAHPYNSQARHAKLHNFAMAELN